MGNAQPLLERFNTQPPEGGWRVIFGRIALVRFQHTAA